MNLSPFGKPILIDGKIQSYNLIEECKRLADEFRAKPEKTISYDDGITYITIPPKSGFDVETCPASDIINRLLDNNIKKSSSQVTFLWAILAVRFPKEFSTQKALADDVTKLELEFVESNAKNDMAYFGRKGFQNMVHENPDSRLNFENIRVKNKKNDNIQIYTFDVNKTRTFKT